MLKLTTAQTNTIEVSLFENSIDPFNNYYLIDFTNLQTRKSYVGVGVKGNVNERCISLRFSVNGLNTPNFKLQENSFFKYDIYEQTSSSNTDITDSSVLGLRETGKAWVNGTSEVVYVKEPEANNTNSVYLKT